MLNRATDAGAGTTLGVVGIATTNGIGMLFQPGQADARGLVVRAFSAQTADLLQIQKSSATVVSVINASGSFGIQQSSPTAYLHLGAGTATASTAPLKFTAGTSLTTPESGTMEYDGKRLFFTSTSVRRGIVESDYAIITPVTVANTVTETTVFTASLPANSMSAKDVFDIALRGYFSTANASDTFTVSMKIGGTTVTSVTLSAHSVTDAPFHADLTSTIRTIGATGTVSAFMDCDIDNVSQDSYTSSTVVDTTGSNDITVTVQWDNALAGNTFTLDQAYLLKAGG